MTTVYKDMRGNWQAKDTVPLECGRLLKISTHKVSSGQLVTSAQVGKQDGVFFCYMMYQDFSERLLYSAPARVTSKVVEAQHAEAMAMVPSLIKSVADFYAAKVAEPAATVL